MPMISLKCPNCGAALDVNDSLEKIQCNYCGNVCILSEALTQKQVIDESHKLKPFLDLAESSMQSGDYARCEEYADKAIEIDGKNAYAWYLKACGSEGLREGSGDVFLDKALQYCDNESLRKRIGYVKQNPGSLIKRKIKTRRLKIDASAADKRFMKDRFIVYVDKDKVAIIKGGDTTTVQLSVGKHEVSMRINSQVMKAFKRKVTVDDSDLRLKISRDKEGNFSWDLDEY